MRSLEIRNAEFTEKSKLLLQFTHRQPKLYFPVCPMAPVCPIVRWVSTDQLLPFWFQIDVFTQCRRIITDLFHNNLPFEVFKQTKKNTFLQSSVIADAVWQLRMTFLESVEKPKEKKWQPLKLNGLSTMAFSLRCYWCIQSQTVSERVYKQIDNQCRSDWNILVSRRKVCSLNLWIGLCSQIAVTRYVPFVLHPYSIRIQKNG